MTTLEAILLVIAITLAVILSFIILIGNETTRNLEEIKMAIKYLSDYIIKKGERK